MAKGATPRGANGRLAQVALAVLSGLFLVLIVRRAWLCDDAYITLRTVDHFIHGRGLVYNVGERVQAYTHPLWVFLVSGVVAATREFYHSCTLLSLALSAAAAAILALRALGRGASAILGIAALCASRAFVDFSTSGLENPLTHLLLAGFCACYLREAPGAPSAPAMRSLAILAGLASLNRLDSMLLVAPALVEAVTRRSEERASLASRGAAIALGFAPLVLWEAFALVYYGFPLPNTAYAKVWTGIPPSELLRQGPFYLANSIHLDPLTLSLIAASVVAAWRCRDRRLVALAAGCVLYLLYVVGVGGDFMSGRFLSAPFALAVVVVARAVSRRARWISLAAVLAFGLLSPASPLRGDAGPRTPEEAIDAHGVSDERAFYAPWAGLRAGPQDATLRTYKRSQWGLAWRQRALSARAEGRSGRFLVTADAIGYAGFYAGPDVHIVDRPALADPFLARLPVAQEPAWRIGHFFREIPDGYLESLKTERNALRDPAHRALYDDLSRITRGPLWTLERWRAIWELNRP